MAYVREFAGLGGPFDAVVKLGKEAVKAAQPAAEAMGKELVKEVTGGAKSTAASAPSGLSEQEKAAAAAAAAAALSTGESKGLPGWVLPVGLGVAVLAGLKLAGKI